MGSLTPSIPWAENSTFRAWCAATVSQSERTAPTSPYLSSAEGLSPAQMWRIDSTLPRSTSERWPSLAVMSPGARARSVPSRSQMILAAFSRCPRSSWSSRERCFLSYSWTFSRRCDRRRIFFSASFRTVMSRATASLVRRSIPGIRTGISMTEYQSLVTSLKNSLWRGFSELKTSSTEQSSQRESSPRQTL